MAASRTQGARVLARKGLDVLDRFLVREEALAARTADSSSNDANTNSNPFTPSPNPRTGNYNPPRYSLRRQAVLAKKAIQSGRVEDVPASPKVSRILARAGIEVLTPSAAPEVASDGTRKPSTATFKDAEGRTVSLDRRGPYEGKVSKRLFKGTKAERDAPRRQRRTKESMEGMEATIAGWKAAKAEEKAKSRPSLPF